MKSLFLVKPIKRAFNRAVALDAGYIRGYGGLGTMYYELPGIVGGSTDKAIGYLKQAMAIDSNYAYAYVELARIYIEKKRVQEAKNMLQKVLEMKNPTLPADYVIDDRPRAARLLEQIDTKK